MRVESKERVRAAALPLLAAAPGWMLIASAEVTAAGTPALTCEGTKLQIAGEYNACLLKAEGLATETGSPRAFVRAVRGGR